MARFHPQWARVSSSFLVLSIVLLACLSSSSAIQRGADFNTLVEPWNGVIEVRSGGSLDEFTGELLVLGVHADSSGFSMSDAVKTFDTKYANGALAEEGARVAGLGKMGTSTSAVRLVEGNAKRVVLFGIGPAADGALGARSAAQFAVETAKELNLEESVGLFVEGATADMVASMVEGGLLGGYVDERYKGVGRTGMPPKALELVGVDMGSGENQAAAAAGKQLAMGVITAKQLTVAPANIVNPVSFAQAARTIATENNLAIEVFGREQCTKLGMGSYLSVGQGSIWEPQFVHMTYSPQGDVKKRIALVAKTITFDSGGYNLKTGSGSLIQQMQYDMAGGAALLGTANVIGKLMPKDVEVHFIMPAVENMINGKASHPGDIFLASNGKTIEVTNTDAEGRLALADALVFADNLKDIDYIVDIATLTGAVRLALGKNIAGLWSPSDDLAKMIVESGRMGGERFWQMPLLEDYLEGMRSPIADLRNTDTTSEAGSITAALFLKEFVTNKNWAHMDIAGLIWGGGGRITGGAGFAVRTFVNFIKMVSAGAE